MDIMEYKEKQGVVVYRSKLHATLKRNFQIMPGAAWLKLLLQHVPDRGEHLVRYYDWYSNRSRGERKAIDPESTKPTSALEENAEPDTEFSQAVRNVWARLIKKVSAIAPALLYLLHPCSRTKWTRSFARTVAVICAFWQLSRKPR